MKRVLFFLSVFLLVSAVGLFAGGGKETTEEAPEAATAEPAAVQTGGEAPMLAERVAKKELPPVEERLPQDPLVVKPVEKIGTYGGTWHVSYSGKPTMMLSYKLTECPVRWSADYQDLLPNVLKEWEASPDGKDYTFYLRKGMKWSDGEPFTATDWMFWYEDIVLNDELTPVKPSFMRIGGDLGTLEKIDDYTINITFSQPFGMFMEYLQSSEMYAPKHFMKQYHPDYADAADLEAEMKKGEFEVWTDLFGAMNTYGDSPDRPTLRAWFSRDTVDTPVQYFERNPYYWKVDTAGNQLPYIDRLERQEIPAETIVLRAMAGEIDCQNRHVSSIQNYQMLMENREKGDYRLAFGTPPGLNIGTIYLNYFHEDPVLRELFLDLNFRIALSIGVDREEINDILYKGLAVISQQGPSQGDPWYEERFGKAYTEFDPDRANKLLDEIGMKWDPTHSFRLRPDGKKFESVIIVLGGEASEDPLLQMAEMCKNYYKEIGISVSVKPTNVSLWVAQMRAGDFDMGFYMGNAGSAGYAPVKSVFVFPFRDVTYWGSQWGQWYATGGTAGTEPPPEVKRLQDIYDAVNSEPSIAKRTEYYKEAFEIHMENLWLIGLLNRSPYDHYYVVKNNFKNVPDHLQMESGSTLKGAYYCAQYYFEQ